MKNIKLLFLLALVSFFGCQKNLDVTTKETVFPESVENNFMDIEVKGSVSGYHNAYSFVDNGIPCSHASVQLIHEGVILDETNTDERGKFNFPTQSVPTDGTYIYIEAPGHHPNTYMVRDADFFWANISLLSDNYEYVDGEAISSNTPKVQITGKLQESIVNNGRMTFFITNANNELVGNYVPDANQEIDIATLANEELFLYYDLIGCGLSAPIPIGPFSEDTDLGLLYEGSNILLNDYVEINITSDNCGGSIDPHGIVFLNKKDQTIYNGYFHPSQTIKTSIIQKCLLDIDPEVKVTLITDDENSFGQPYGEAVGTYVSGQSLDIHVSTCLIDDTFLKFTLGANPEVNNNFFTYADITSDDRVIIKQYGVYSENDITLTTAPGSGIGTLLGNMLYRDTPDNIFSSENMTIEITLNDGEFIEGTFEGNTIDPFENSLGMVQGSFRARIQ